MRRALLVLWLWLGGAVLGAGEELGRVVDQPLRFVNGRVITIGDLRWRNGMRVESYRRAGRPLPETRAALLAFHRESLEELTDEELLLQQAEELGVSIDREQLASDVRSEARERGLDIRQLAQLKRWREREAKLRVVVNWVEGRAPAVAPQQLALAYQQRRQEFARPARARVRLLALRPASDDERRELRRQLANLMRDVQQSPEEPLAALARSRLEEFLAADVEGQQSILLAFAQAVAASESVQREGRALVERARELLARAQSALGEAQCRAELERWRAELALRPASEREAAFADLARARSQGPHAADGGLLGWVDGENYGPEIARQALATPVGALSPVFASAGALAVLLVVEREEARVQEFQEVSALLLAALEREQRNEARRRLLAALRARAVIRDVVDLGTLVP